MDAITKNKSYMIRHDPNSTVVLSKRFQGSKTKSQFKYFRKF